MRISDVRPQLGGFARLWPLRRKTEKPCGCRDEEMVPMWTAEDEISLARRVVALQEKAP